jgi:17beta-estradiol 17-dehydrogenase / very-long-chain 3-oxoacyl-CoA reductase
MIGDLQKNAVLSSSSFTWLRTSNLFDFFLRLFLVIGLYVFMSNLFTLLGQFYGKFLVFRRNLASRYGKGSWVVITGGAEGIGRSYGFEFARQGFNIVLIDKQKDLVKQTMNEIKSQFGVNCKYILADFTHSYDKGFFDSILRELTDLDISVLVNNVGVGGLIGPLDQTDDDKIKEVMMVNMFSPMMMTRKLIDRLSQRDRRSAVITVSSHQGLVSIPKNIPYASTKAFLMHFNQGLIEEIGTKKVDFLVVCPGAVITRMTNFVEKFYNSCTPDECVKSSLKNLGRTTFTYGHWKHEIFMALVTNFRPLRSILMADISRRIKNAGERLVPEEKAKVE